MKKAKILVPAIAALVLSSAAAVTGTVAWFTSTRTASITASPVTVINGSQGNLSTTLVAGKGIQEVDSVNGTVTHKTFTDGSVDLSTGNVYGANEDATEFVDATSTFAGPEGTNSFRATHFQITFKYDFYDGPNDIATVQFKGDSAVTKDPADEKLPDIAPALRVGFKAGSEIKVWAPFLKYANLSAGLEHANGAGVVGSYTGKYAQTVIIDETDTAGNSGQNNIVELTKTSKESATVDVYTWFEGCDDACVNSSSLMSGYEIAMNFGVTLSASI